LILAVSASSAWARSASAAAKNSSLPAKFDFATYDILFNNSPEGTALRDKARVLKVEACSSATTAIERGGSAIKQPQSFPLNASKGRN